MWCYVTKDYINAEIRIYMRKTGHLRAAIRFSPQYSGITMEIDATNTVGPEDAEPPSPQTAQDTRRRARAASA
jgi:hypothetical protein